MKLRELNWAVIFTLAIFATAASAQDQKQDPQQVNPSAPIQPLDMGLGGGYDKKPAAAARGVSAPFDPQPYDPSQVMPDQNTLAGAEFLTVGSLRHTRNIFDPSISISELGQYAPAGPGQPSLTGVSLISGALDFDRTWSRYHMTAVYNGGVSFNIGPNSSRYPFQDLIFTQEANWARWHVLFRDDFTAAPGAAFTGTGMGGPGLIAQFSSMLGDSLNTFSQAFLPGETIETGNAMRYRNAVLGQAEYSLSRRSALTLSGSYGLLHFTGPGYVSSSMVDVQGGYDYLLDPTNTVAILGSYGKIDYTGTGSSTSAYVAALAYGRKLTGRMAFQVAVGPQKIISTGASGNFQLWFVSINSALSYERRRGGVSFNYMRGLTPGSGVTLGATGNTFSGAGHYQFTRFWTGTVNGGYALSNSLAPAGAATSNFSNWFIGANLGRLVGAHADVNFNYGLQRQGNPTVCPVVSCGVAGFQQTFGVTANLHFRRAG